MGEAKQTTTVFIVDDDDGVRESLAALLASVGLRAVPYASPAEFVDQVKMEGPSCIILDVRMPGMSGMAVQQALMDKGIDIPIIFITGHGDVPLAVTAMKRGAADFIQKPLHQQTLLDTIQRVIGISAGRHAEWRREQDSKALLKRLTNREHEVFELLVAGLPNKSIARRLGLSTRTVEVHRASVFHKLELSTVVELVRAYGLPEKKAPTDKR